MKKLSILVVAAFLLALLVPAAFAQGGSVKGFVKGSDGKPLPGAVVEMSSKETGRNYKLTADKNGNIFSLGIQPGKYDIKVTHNGQVIYTAGNFLVRFEEARLEIDIQKELAAQGQPQMSEEQKKAIEAQEKENVKIRGLNEKLAAAKAAQDAGNFDQAVAILTEATQQDATRDLIWFKLADAQRLAAGKKTDPTEKKTAYGTAVESYKKAIELASAGNPKPDIVGGAYNNLGEAYAKSGQTDEAIKAYEQAAQADPTHAGTYYFNEGAVLTNTNKFKEANAAFDKALQADPKRAAAWYWKGANGINMATLGKDGKMIPAAGTEEAFNKYLELEPEGQMAEQAKAMLTALGAKVETSFGKSKAAGKKK
ncbi:MAG TPA: tetratricopeptide repeat protein [Terriglobales bacterium]|nr:tetratricopeptide repeat protein [Terriglobales bacterium]